MKVQTPRERAAMREATEQYIQAAHRHVWEQRIKAQEPADYLFDKINQHSAQTPVVYAVPQKPKQEPPKITERASDTLRALSALAALAVISVVVCVNVLWFM